MRHQRSPTAFNRSKIQMQGCPGGILTTLSPLCLDMKLTCWFKLNSFSLNLEYDCHWSVAPFRDRLNSSILFSLCWHVCAARHYHLSSKPWLLLKNRVSSALATVTLSRVPARMRGNCWFVASVGLDCVSCSTKMWVKTVRSLQKDSIALGMTADNCI